MREKMALVLGGGGSRGAYEIGVWKACLEQDHQFDIVTGTSVGAINAAMVAQDLFELARKLWRELETDMIFDIDTEGLPNLKFAQEIEIAGMSAEEGLAYLREMWKHKGAPASGLNRLLRCYIDEDKVRKSPLDYGLVVTEVPPLKDKQVIKGHRLFKEDIPQGRLHDYIMASAACFPAAQAYEIDDKTFIDGGYVDTVPVSMAVERGASRVIAVDLNTGNPLQRIRSKNFKNLTWISSRWNLGSMLIFDKDNAERIMELGHLDALKAFGVCTGRYYTFKAGQYTDEEVKGADAAAKVFELDPLNIYAREEVNVALAALVAEMRGRKNLELLSARTRALAMADKVRSLPQNAVDLIMKPESMVLGEEARAARYLLKEKIV